MSGSLRTNQLEEEKKTGRELIVQENLQPLLIPEIVRELIKFIRTSKLPKYRFVCKLWNEEIVHGMKNRTTFLFKFSHCSRFINFLQNGQTFFGFKNLKLMYDLSFKSEDTKFQLLASHGKFLRRLEFVLTCVPVSMQKLRNVLFLASCQDLEYLKLTNLPEVDEFAVPYKNSIELYKLTTLDIHLGERSQFPNKSQHFFKHLLRMAPNLVEFHLSTTKRAPHSLESMTTSTRALLTVSPPKLKRLYFHSEIPKELITTLSHSAMNIQKLFFEDLERFTVNFDSNVSGNKITINAYDICSFSGIPRPIMIEYIQQRLDECENGVSCTQLLRTFLYAFQERIRNGVAVPVPMPLWSINKLFHLYMYNLVCVNMYSSCA